MGFGIDKMLAVGTAEKPALTNFIDLNLIIDKNNQEKGWYTVSEIKKTNIKIDKPKISLDQRLKDAISNKTTVKEDIKINSQYQNADQKLTLFEKARIIGVRAQMLNENDTPRVDIGDLVDSLDIAILEYNSGSLSLHPALYIIRTLPNGQKISIYPTLQNII